ncbi:MAG: hypothetical protein HRT74_12790, partial [Flavobacteriales bacterium]|nr:hypothetical protein [Flavobacteriales bacterium]
MLKNFLGIIILLSIFPFLALADGGSGVNQSIQGNEYLVGYIAQLAPMAINPYLTIFLTSLFSNLGLTNDLVMTNAYLANGWVLGISGALVAITSLPKILGDKLTGPLSLAINYLDTKAAIIINISVLLLPVFFDSSEQMQETAMMVMGLDISFKTLVLIIVSVIYLVVVMTVKFFLETLIFLSPIPLLDSIFEILKIVLTIGLTFLALVFPYFALFLTIISFLICLIFYKRAKRKLVQIKYLIIDPVLNVIFFRKVALVSPQSPDKVKKEDCVLLLPIVTVQKIGSIAVAKKAHLQKENEISSVHTWHWIKGEKEEVLDLNGAVLVNRTLSMSIEKEGKKLIKINNSYRKHIDEIAGTLGIEVERKSLMDSMKKGVFSSMRGKQNDVNEALQ